MLMTGCELARWRVRAGASELCIATSTGSAGVLTDWVPPEGAAVNGTDSVAAHHALCITPLCESAFDMWRATGTAWFRVLQLSSVGLGLEQGMYMCMY